MDQTKVGRRGVKMTCGKCGQVGHNRRSCKGDPTAATTTEEGSNAATTEECRVTRQNGATSQSGVSIVPATKLKLPVKRNRGAERTARQVQKRN
ncbi:hypothetical protein RHMOL_Rhmol02G0274800 [Rhododendron molle]|uniref:Uncharacterized protein n=1 Tax=Rhododendron molle TaxID=49168 RepID=A0ACC0PW51_RHOML|nr:hypothetical protein RHMOL_Rhmol02G0274800 [Rhododendron molle]